MVRIQFWSFSCNFLNSLIFKILEHKPRAKGKGKNSLPETKDQLQLDITSTASPIFRRQPR